MARVLVHYDISDPAARESFRNAILSETFSPTFTEQTESVYAAHVSTTEANVADLKQALQAAAVAASVCARGVTSRHSARGVTSRHST